MLVVIPTHSGDVYRTKELLLWIERLGRNVGHDLLIVADAGTEYPQILECLRIGRRSFESCDVVSNRESVKGWPDGCYSLFRTATASVYQTHRRPFLLLEPDAIPLRTGWLNQIEEAYFQSGKPFMGCIYDGEREYTGGKFMSGIAVYPADTEVRLEKRSQPVHWDIDGAGVMVSQGAHTHLIKHVFGERDRAPVFAGQAQPGTNVYDLKSLGDAAIFHRNKDGSLIAQLRRTLFNERLRENISVVFPVCARDINTALAHSAWMVKMTSGRKWRHQAVISFDIDTPIVLLNQFNNNLAQCFESVRSFNYPRSPFQTYPHAANWAFQNAAYRMSKQDRFWLWMEADAIALRYDWLDVLQQQFESSGRKWFGPIVPHMGHLQGTAIYPPDAAFLMPKTMAAVEQAFDMMSQEIVSQAGDAHPYMFHMWTLINRMPCPVGGGEAPANITADEIRRWLPRESVFLHRVKDLSVLNLLISGQFKT